LNLLLKKSEAAKMAISPVEAYKLDENEERQLAELERVVDDMLKKGLTSLSGTVTITIPKAKYGLKVVNHLLDKYRISWITDDGEGEKKGVDPVEYNFDFKMKKDDY
jgi:hypothetical protein